MNGRQVWKMVLDDLQLRLPRSDYETWLQGTAIVAFEDGLAVISTPNSFAKQWLDRQAGDLIRQALAGVLGYPVQLRIVVSRAKRKGTPAAREVAPRQRPAPTNAPPRAPTSGAPRTRPAKDQPIAPRDKRKIGAFWVQDCVLDDYAPVLGPVGLAALSFFYMMANADTRECWFSQRHLARHLGIHRSHELAPALDLLRKLQLLRDTGRRTTSGAYIWELLEPGPIDHALLQLLAAEEAEAPRTIAEKLARLRELYPRSWRPVRTKAQFGSLDEVLATVEQALRAGEDPAPAAEAPD